MALHTDQFLLVDLDPTLWEEGVRVFEYVWVGLGEYRGHADDGLRLLEMGCNIQETRTRKERFLCYGLGSVLGWILTPAGISHSL